MSASLHRIVMATIFGLFVAGAGFAAAIAVNPFPTPVVGVVAFNAAPQPKIANLEQIIAGAQTDDQAYRAIEAYYNDNYLKISDYFSEPNPERLKALFIMYVVHISHPYNMVETPAETLIDYVRKQPASHCLWYATWQHKISSALGLKSRMIALDNAEHGWVEVEIDGHWEIFDSTIDVWLSQPGEVLLTGAPRQYRRFYLLATTEDAPNNLVYKLSRQMIGLGVSYGRGTKIVFTPEPWLNDD